MSTEYDLIIAKIESTHLGLERGCIMSTMLHVTYGGGMGQGIGGMTLDRPTKGPDGKTIRQGTAYGAEWIRRTIRACGVEFWEEIPGRTIHVLFKPGTHRLGSSSSSSVLGIAPLPTEPGEPFIFADLATQFDSEGNTK